jgi:hypothetical protein
MGEVVSLERNGARVRSTPASRVAEPVEVGEIVWATGFRRGDPWPERALPPGVARVGVPCLRTRRSGFLRGFTEDARVVVQRLLEGRG